MLRAINGRRQSKSDNNYNFTIKSKNKIKAIGSWSLQQIKLRKYVSTVCKKRNTRLNTISRIGEFLGQKENEILISTFVYSNVSNGPLSTFQSANAFKKYKPFIQPTILKNLLRLWLEPKDFYFLVLFILYFL